METAENEHVFLRYNGILSLIVYERDEKHIQFNDGWPTPCLGQGDISMSTSAMQLCIHSNKLTDV